MRAVSLNQKYSAKNTFYQSADMNSKCEKTDKNSANAYLGNLRESLTDGWKIIQPVFLRPLWSSVNNEKLGFHFVLQRGGTIRLMTVPKTTNTARFIHDQHLDVQENTLF